MSYNSFCNPYSVDISKLSPQNSIMNSLYNSNIVSILNGQNPLDLSPFKIVTLDWLLQIGKYKPSFIYSNFIIYDKYSHIIMCLDNKYFNLDHIDKSINEIKSSYTINKCTEIKHKSQESGFDVKMICYTITSKQ